MGWRFRQPSQDDLLLTVKQEAAIFGTVVAIAVVGLLGWWLRSVADNYGLVALWAIVVPLLAICLLLAHWMDKRDAARRERERSDLS